VKSDSLALLDDVEQVLKEKDYVGLDDPLEKSIQELF